uniref:Chemosensory protein n=1 Tax=Meteorus pulchricornis TaxID=51522 RepID=A0A1S5VFH9_9HYME
MSRKIVELLCSLIIIHINVISAVDHVHFSPEILLRNERLLARFVDCLVDEGPCLGPIAKFKKEIPKMMETQCARCQEQIKVLSAKVMQHIREHKPEKWKKIQEIYDPDHKHQEKLDGLLDDYQ